MPLAMLTIKKRAAWVSISMHACGSLSIVMLRLGVALKTTFPSEVLAVSDKRSYRNLTTYNDVARQCWSFCNRLRLNFQAFPLPDMKWRPEKAVAWVKRRVIALVFAN